MGCAAPERWSKYTTLDISKMINLTDSTVLNTTIEHWRNGLHVLLQGKKNRAEVSNFLGAVTMQAFYITAVELRLIFCPNLYMSILPRAKKEA